MNRMSRRIGREEVHPEGVRQEKQPCDKAYKFAGQYLTGLLPELNLRLFCDAETECGRFPQRILWVEKITMLEAEGSASDRACKEKYCQEEKPVFSGQIKYMAEKIKNRFMAFRKRKGR